MASRGETCFYRWFLRHQTVCGGLFSRFIFGLLYAVFLGLLTLAHRGLLIYLYYQVSDSLMDRAFETSGGPMRRFGTRS